MRRYAWIALPLIAVAVRLWFVAYTSWAAEDAYITFQFARNVARGDGFALIPDQPVYGTTTPLLTILLAGWLLLSPDVILGARLIALLAVAGGISFLYFAIPFKRAAFFACLLIALSPKLIIDQDMQGMEMPLLFLFMAGSFYGFMKGKAVFAGAMAGLLLWTRVDAVVWVWCVAFIYLFMHPRDGVIFAAVTSAVYLPWVLFAWWYFGSPIPLTIIAKQVTYGLGAQNGYPVHILGLVNYLTIPALLGAVFGAFMLRGRKYWVLPLFFALEAAVLIFGGMTFFLRYFYLLTVTAYILIGFGMGFVVERAGVYKGALNILALALVYYVSRPTFEMLRVPKEPPSYYFDAPIEMGKWLNKNTPEGTTVLLEPLGKVGWYADRIMYDEVGLATPLAVELHRRDIPGARFFAYFWPDYLITNCNVVDARAEMDLYYDFVKKFDCFEIWTRTTAR